MAAEGLTLRLRARVNWPRLHHLEREMVAKIRRAPKRERPGIADRYVRAVVEKCVRVVVAR